LLHEFFYIFHLHALVSFEDRCWKKLFYH
jgi:hypothetical protein